MLSGVLHSDGAIKVNIQIMRVFTRMRKLLEAHKEILKKLDNLERRDIEQDEKIILISEYGEKCDYARSLDPATGRMKGLPSEIGRSPLCRGIGINNHF